MKFKIVSVVAVALLGAGYVPAQTSSAARKDKEKLVYVLYVSRHGVRSPTGKTEQYSRFSSAAWPTWDVAPGYLTPHGYELMKLFGTYDGELLRAEHLLSGRGCAEASNVTFRADSDERTQGTAKALAEGIFPGCTVPVDALKEGTNDPLFHLPDSEITASQAALAASAILGRIGNDPAAVASAYRDALANLDGILADCGTAVPSHQRVSILDISASVAPGTGDHLAEMRGPLNTAASLTENFLLEYAEGMESANVGWGCVDSHKLRTLVDLHTAASDLALRTPAVAIAQSAHLLQAIDRSIQQAILRKPIAGAPGKPSDKALFLVGHDTNLSNIAGALGLNWLIDGRRDDTPPGSALRFEIWQVGDAAQFTVRLSFTTQTLEQMRSTTPLDTSQPPPQVPLFIPGCSHADMSCDASSFHHLIEGVLAKASSPRSATAQK